MVVFLVGINDLGLSLTEEDPQSRSDYDERGPGALFAHSRIVQLLNVWYQIRFNQATVVQDVWDRAYEPVPFEGGTPAPDALESLLPQLDEFKRNVRALIRTTREAGAEPVFLTQPVIFEDTPYWSGIQGTTYYLTNQRRSISAATFRQLLDIYNAALMNISAEERVPCLDLAEVMSGRRDLMYDTCHYNEPGAEFVAEQVASFLVDRGL